MVIPSAPGPPLLLRTRFHALSRFPRSHGLCGEEPQIFVLWMSVITADSRAKSTDMAKKDSAMKEQNMAKEMMDKKDEAGCMMHANKAMEMMK
ncbi:MAG: hypothetical protein ABSE69_19575 [Roseiarcus sp.]